MANVTNTGTTGYPGVLDTRTSLTDGPAGSIIEANHPNGLGAAVLAIENELGTDPAGTAVDVKTRLNVSQNSDGTIKSSVIVATGSTTVGYSSGVFTISSPEVSFGLSNLGFIVSRSSNALTIYLQTRTLSTPTAANPAQIMFRSTPVTTGAYDIINVTAQTSVTISSGSSTGMRPNQNGRLYFGAVNNLGTAELTVHNPMVIQAEIGTITGITQYKPNEAELQSTTAEGGAGGADTSGLLYSTSARVSLPYRMLGYMDIVHGASAGTWSADPTAIQVLGYGIPRTGELIQRVGTVSAQGLQGTTTIPTDNTVPLQAEGDRYMGATITASNGSNLLRHQVMGYFANGTITRQTMALFRYGANEALATARGNGTVDNVADCIALDYISTITSAAAVGFQVRAGNGGASTTTFNGEGGAGLDGGTLNSHYYIDEICT